MPGGQCVTNAAVDRLCKELPSIGHLSLRGAAGYS